MPTDPLSPAAARDRLSTEMARRWDAVNTALADLDRVEPPDPSHLHAGTDCWLAHTGCLAARIRRTLTGEDTDHG